MPRISANSITGAGQTLQKGLRFQPRLLLMILSGVGLLGLGLWFSSPPNPTVHGKRISVWYDQLCGGVFGGRSQNAGRESAEALAFFAESGTSGVPFLASKLRYLRSERLDHLFLWAVRNPVTKHWARNMIHPESRRTYAAVALRRIGPPAESAIPALLEAWKHDCPSVQVNCITALASILYGECPDSWTPPEWSNFQSKVIRDAASRFPDAAESLNIQPAAIP